MNIVLILNELSYCFPRYTLIKSGLTIALFFCIVLEPFGQIPPSTSSTSKTKNNHTSSDDSSFKIYEDSFDLRNVSYHSYDFENPQDTQNIALDSLEVTDNQYELIQKQVVPYLDLGRIGSPARSIFASYNQHYAFLDLGIHTWDLYLYPTDQVRFYRQRIPIARTFVSQGINTINTSNSLQDNTLIELDFSRNIVKGKQLVLHYRRITDLGYFKENRTGITSFKTALLFSPDSTRWQSALSYSFNEVLREENGGVVDDSLILDDTLHALRFSIPNTLSDAHLRLTQYHIQSFNRYYLQRKKSTRYFHDNLSFEKTVFKYYDKNTNTEHDSLFYRTLLIDSRGISNIISEQKISNDIYFGYEMADRVHSHLGIVGQFSRWKNDTSIRNYILLQPYAKANIKWGSMMYSSHRVLFSILDRKGYDISNHFILQKRKWGSLDLSLSLEKKPSPIQTEWLILSQRLVRDTVFKSVFTHNLGGQYAYRPAQIQFGIHIIQLVNYIYYDTASHPIQLANKLMAVEYSAKHHLHIGAFHMENQIFYTASRNLAELLIPEWSTRHDLYLQHPFYNDKTMLRYGLTLNITKGGAFAPAYNPLLGQYIANKKSYPYSGYYTTAPYLMLKVPQFTLFVRIDRAEDLIRQRLWHYAANWPAPDWEFRLGIKWILLK